ncbi:hypothetical protein Tco_0753456 [Tanacetum coccineum]
MGREARYYIPDNVLELVDDLASWNTYPWGEYFWRIFYLRTLNVVPRKNERDSKKDKEKVVEPPKKQKKPAKGSKKKNKAGEQSPKKMTTYNLYGFVWSLKIFPNNKYWWKKDPDVIPRGISWSITEKFCKRDYSRLFAQWSNPILTFVPSDSESVQSWCIDSFQYFTNHHESFQRDNVGEVLVQDVEQEQNLICPIGDTADEQNQFDLNIHSDHHV